MRYNLDEISKKIIIVFFFIIICFLTITSMFETSEILISEKTIYLKDLFIKHFVVFFLLVCFIYFIKKKNINFNFILLKSEARIFFILMIALILWITCTQLPPVADQRSVLQIANFLHLRDFTEYKEYISMYHNQLGQVAILYFLQFLLGPYNFIAIQILNSIAIVLIIYVLSTIAQILFCGNYKNICTIVLVLFIPLSLYVTFIYGNLWGLAFSLLAILMEYKYLKNNSFKYVLGIASSLTIAILLKSNYLIFMVGILIFLVLDFIRNLNWKSILSIFIIIVVYFMGSFLLEKGFYDLTEVNLEDGIPSVAWIAMGLQESDMAPGWYNEFNRNTYLFNGKNADIVSDISIKSIKYSIENFIENPKYAIKFFYQKIVSQWNNPTFQGFWINERPSNIEQSVGVHSIMYGKLNKVLTEFMNIYQSIILEGVLCYIILGIKKIKINELIFAVIFIGGFIFHLFWEAKAQYTFTYFVLLIPYAVRGYNDFTDWLLKRINTKRLRSL